MLYLLLLLQENTRKKRQPLTDLQKQRKRDYDHQRYIQKKKLRLNDTVTSLQGPHDRATDSQLINNTVTYNESDTTVTQEASCTENIPQHSG